MSNKQSFLQRHHFLMRRLHSLSGILPIGVFLIGHLTTNSSIAWGVINSRAAEAVGEGTVAAVGESTARRVGTFQHDVAWINESLPFLVLVEIVLWLSIAFHAVLGVIYATGGKSNVQRYSYQDNWRYTLQRVSGYIGIAFIFYHVATLRWGWNWLVPGGTKWSYLESSSTLAMALRGDPSGDWTAMGVVVSLFYLLGVTMLVFHFANGLWTSAITWGLTVSARAQRRWGYVCTAVGVAMMAAGWSALIGFLTLDVEHARMIEEAMRRGHEGGAAVETAGPGQTNTPGAALVPASGSEQVH